MILLTVNFYTGGGLRLRRPPFLPVLCGAGWSSPVARQAHNLKVAGSNPAPATKFPKQDQRLRQTPRTRVRGVRLSTPQYVRKSDWRAQRLRGGHARHNSFSTKRRLVAIVERSWNHWDSRRPRPGSHRVAGLG